MSPSRGSAIAGGRVNGPVFAALGDETRLMLLGRLAGGRPCSIAQLTAGSHLTRQAITKHLRVLSGAGLVRGVRRGREIRFEFERQPIEESRKYLEQISAQWDDALSRLKSFVDEDGGLRSISSASRSADRD